MPANNKEIDTQTLLSSHGETKPIPLAYNKYHLLLWGKWKTSLVLFLDFSFF
jgi:hypothetical protein